MVLLVDTGNIFSFKARVRAVAGQALNNKKINQHQSTPMLEPQRIPIALRIMRVFKIINFLMACACLPEK